MDELLGYRGRRVAVTGGNGFIGSALVRRLRALDADVVSWSRSRPPVPSSGERQLDLRDPAAVVEAVIFDRPEIVIHLAASGVSHAEAHSAWVVGANVAMVANLIDALVVHTPDTRLVAAGTMAEYGPKPDGDLDEDDATVPDTAYGIAKLAAALFLRAYAPARGLNAIHARLFGVCGPGEREPRVFPSLLRRLRERLAVPLTDGTQVRDLVHVEDACEALLRLAIATTVPSGAVVNVGTGVGVSIRDVAERLCDELGASRELLRFGARAPAVGDRARLVARVARLRAAIGWVPPARFASSGRLVAELEGGS